MSAVDWCAFQVYPGSGAPSAVSRLLTAIRPVTDDARSWHYLHFADAGGFHVRLRVLAPDSRSAGDVVDAVSAAATRAGALTVRTVYLPETHKYGVHEQLAANEELFRRSSAFAQDLLELDLRQRATIAAGLMLSTLRSFPDVDPVSFSYHYQWYWQGGVSSAPAPAGGSAPAQRHRVSPAPAALTRSFTELFHDTAMSSYLYLFHHLHLTNNRLGLPRAAEAAVARAVHRALRTEDQHRITAIERNN